MADAARDSIAWVHLSDFHFKADKAGKAGKDYGRDEVQLALLEDLRMFAGKADAKRGAEPVPLDFIFVTGDIAYSGKPEEYDVAAKFFGELLKATGVPAERLFLVPGNHDGDRDEHLGLFQREIQDRKVFAEYWSSLKTRRKIFADKLAAYRELATRLNPTISIPEEQPGGFFQRIECRARTVALAGLGSSWLGQGGEADERHLITGKEQAYDLAGGAALKDFDGVDLKLALMHHPLDWMQRFDEKEMKKLLADHVDLLLHGHLHETGLDSWSSPGRKLVTIAAGAAYEDSDWRNAYNLVQVSFGKTRHVKIWLRAFAVGEGCFVKDVETYAEADDGIWEWDLPGPARPAKPARAKAKTSTKPDPRRYLEHLREENRYLDIRGIGAKTAERMELGDVYTRLRVLEPREREVARRKGKGKHKELEDELLGRHGAHDPGRELSDVLRDHEDLVIVGDPGSGKTTFLRLVALSLAEAHLREGRAEAMKRIGLKGNPLFPILVQLGPFGQFLREEKNDGSLPTDSPEHFYRYLDCCRKGFSLGLSDDCLRERVKDGKCFLLLDGLDEVPGDELRERLGRIVEQVVREGRRVGNRHIVTSRTGAYTGRVVLDGQFTRSSLADFGPAEVEEFVRRWTRALYRVPAGETKSAAADRAEAYRRELSDAISSHPNVGPMTANPLMLTVLAVVHWDKKKLPEQRAELYDAAVNYLIETRKDQSKVPSAVRAECLRRIALRMFEGPNGFRKTIGRSEAAGAVGPLLGCSQERALAFLDDESLHSGILVSRTEGEIEFWHLTFQEYLAARELAVRDWWAVVKDRLFDAQWNEVILLLAGCLRKLGTDNASDFIRKILDAGVSLPGKARAVGLIGRILRDILPYGGDPAQGTGYKEALNATLSIFENGGDPVPEEVRVEVGEALGQAGDPRLENEGDNRVFIPSGTFSMGAQREDRVKPGYYEYAGEDEAPVHRVTVSDFLMDRYPVTVGQFQHFVGAGVEGYLNPMVWDPKGWAWREKQIRSRPDQWDAQLKHPNRPVVNVCWYEADAYARWAKKRLPTEAEWEYAARGSEGRKYPWGNEPPSEQRASYDLRVKHPTPVGIYPDGETPKGIRDLAGNVFEWCADWFGSYESNVQFDPMGIEAGRFRVVRGGSFSDYQRSLRAAYRLNFHPGRGNVDIGFRCVLVASGGQKS